MQSDENSKTWNIINDKQILNKEIEDILKQAQKTKIQDQGVNHLYMRTEEQEENAQDPKFLQLCVSRRLHVSNSKNQQIQPNYSLHHLSTTGVLEPQYIVDDTSNPSPSN